MDLLNRFFYTALGAFSLLLFFVKFSLSHWKKRGILHEKPKLFWGNLKGVGSKRHIIEALMEHYEKYKHQAPFIGFYAWLRPLALVLDLDLIERILKSDANHFDERGLFSNTYDAPLTNNLLQLDGQRYRSLYGKLHKCYETSKLQEMIMPTLLRVANTYRVSLEKRQAAQAEFPAKELVGAYNSDIIAKLAFGIDCDSLLYPKSEFRLMCSQYLQNVTLFKLYLSWSFPTLARLLQYQIFDSIAAAYFARVVRDKLEQRTADRGRHALTLVDGSSGVVAGDFLDLFSEPLGVTSDEVAAQSFTFLLVGLEASNTTLTFCLYELAKAPDLQEQARNEIENVLAQHKDKLTWPCLQDMGFLKQVLYETLRKHSPYPFLLRNTVEDYEVPDSVFMLKQGNSILIPVHAIHNDPEIYPDPSNFDPARFEPSSMQQRHPMSFLPFGMGPRSCLARQFAEAQMLVYLVTLLQRYRVKLCSEARSSAEYDCKRLFLTPKTDVKFCLECIKD